MGPRKSFFNLLPRDVTREILRHLDNQDLCNATSTCKELWKCASATDRLEAFLHDGSHALSLETFMRRHSVNHGLRVKHLRMTLDLQDEMHLAQGLGTPRDLNLLGSVSLALASCMYTLSTLKLENILCLDLLPETLQHGKRVCNILDAIMACQQLRHLHICLEDWGTPSSMCDKLITAIEDKMPKLTILQWKAARRFFCPGPLFFSEDFLADLVASPPNGLQLLQIDDCSSTLIDGYETPPGIYKKFAGQSMRYLALHNYNQGFYPELEELLAGYPNLEEFYLAPFQIPSLPFAFNQLLRRCLWSLRLLSLSLTNTTGFVSPDASSILELPKLEILAIDVIMYGVLPPLGIRCPQLKTLAFNCPGSCNWVQQFAQLPLSSTLVNVQLMLQDTIYPPGSDHIPEFWRVLGVARNLSTLKLVFSAFQHEGVHNQVEEFFRNASLQTFRWPRLQELGLYLASCMYSSMQPQHKVLQQHFMQSDICDPDLLNTGHMWSSIQSLKQNRFFPALSQVNLYPVLGEPFAGEGQAALKTGTLIVPSLNLIGVRVTALEAPGHEIGDCHWRCMGAPGPEAEAVSRALRCLDTTQSPC